MSNETLAKTALARLSVSRMGDVTILIAPGEGAFVLHTMEYNTLLKWASGRRTTGSSARDRQSFFEQIAVGFGRIGSPFATRGSMKEQEGLVKAMLQSGLQVDEWAIPPGLIVKKGAPKPEKKTQNDDEDSNESDNENDSDEKRSDPV